MNEAVFAYPIELVSELSALGLDVDVATFYQSKEDIDDDVQNLKFELHPVGANSRRDLRAYQNVCRLLDDEDYDLVHTHSNFNGSVMRLQAMLAGVSTVHTEHAQHSGFSTKQRLADYASYPVTNGIITNSRATQQSIHWPLDHFSITPPVKVIHNGVNRDRIQSMAELPASVPDPPFIVGVGRFMPSKNYKTLLTAFKFLQDRGHENLSLILVGYGNEWDNLEHKAGLLGIDDAVTFTGRLPRREVFGVIESAEVFVHPSLTEGFGMTVLEAMALGTPVVVSSIDIMKEVVGETGRFAHPHDSKEFAREIEALLSDVDTANELAEQAVQRCEERFDIQQSAKEHAQFYQKILAI